MTVDCEEPSVGVSSVVFFSTGCELFFKLINIFPDSYKQKMMSRKLLKVLVYKSRRILNHELIAQYMLVMMLIVRHWRKCGLAISMVSVMVL